MQKRRLYDRRFFYFDAMKPLLTFLLIALTSSLSAQQIAAYVVDDESNERLAFVHITFDDTRRGTVSDIDGRFWLDKPLPKTLTLSFIGYETKTVSVPQDLGNKKPFFVRMTAENFLINEVELVANENPAHRIVRKAVDFKDENKPTNYPSFSYDSYSKFIVTLDVDSLEIPETPLTREDSSNLEVKEFADRQHLFIMENISERQFIKGKRDNERVIASRISGLQSPNFVVLANEFQSFSFYDDYITVLGDDYLNPIAKGSIKRYVYELQDTIYTAQGDSVFVIAYQPSVRANIIGLKGVVYINSDKYAISNVIAEPASDNTEFPIKIQQMYERVDGEHWFPTQLNTDISMSIVDAGGIVPTAIGRSYLMDIKINPDLEKRKIPSTAVTLEGKAGKRDDEFWAPYRIDSNLTDKEVETYRVLDSIGKAENIDTKLKAFQSIMTGRWPIGPISLDLDRIIQINSYEAVRLGLGVHTNEKFSDRFTVGGFWGWGFRDGAAKYGFDGEYTLSKAKDLRIGYDYSYDTPESGGVPFYVEGRKLLINDYRALTIRQVDIASRHNAYVALRPLSNMKMRLFGQWERRITVGDYQYLDDVTDSTSGSSAFNYTEAGVSIQWAPKDRYMQTQFGYVTIDKTYPIYTLQVARGLEGVWGSDFDYWRVDAKLEQRWRIRHLGDLYLTLTGGWAGGDLPYSRLYGGWYNEPNFASDNNSFETMQRNEFLSDRYAQIILRHNFGRIFKKEDNNTAFWIVTKAAWGDAENPERHVNIGNQTMDQGFFESGVEFTQLFSNLGFGAYYRYGPYGNSDFWENWGLRLNYRFFWQE